MMRKQKKMNLLNTDCDHDIDTPRVAEEKMRTAKIFCWIMTHKVEMNIGNEDLFSARDKVVKKASKMESRPQQREEQRRVDAFCQRRNKMERE